VLLAVVVACGPGAVRGAIIAVSNVSQLNDAVAAAVAGDQIVLASGVYTLSQQLKFLAPNVTIRGATGERDDVIIRGQGMNTDSGPRNGLVLMAAGIQVRDLSIRDFYKDGIKILDEYNPDNLVISNVHTSNLGEHHIKAVRESPTGTQTSDNVLIENLLADQTIARTMRPGGPEGLANFIGGIDVTAGNNWTIRKCIMKDIVGVTAGSIGAISLWGGSNNATIEDNWLIRNGMGLHFRPQSRSEFPLAHRGGHYPEQLHRPRRRRRRRNPVRDPRPGV
jgi:hypothetical protein